MTLKILGTLWVDARRRRRGALMSGLMAAALAVAACGGTSNASASSSKTLQTVVYGIPAWNSLHIAAMVAQDQGFMKKYGVDLQVDLLQSPAEAIPGAIAGSLDFVGVGPEATYAAQNKGGAVKIVAIEIDKNPFQLIVRPNITSIDQLKGQNIVVNAVGVSLDYITARVMMGHLGFTTQQVSFVNGGPPAEQVAALVHGTAQANLNFPPGTQQATAAGMKVLLDVAQQPYYKQVLDESTLEAAPAWYKSHHSAAVGFMEGMTAAMRYLHNPANKSVVINDIAKNEGISQTLATDTYQYFVSTINAIPNSPSVTLTALENGLQADDAAGLSGLPAPTSSGLAGRYDDSLAAAALKALGS